ncbi:hypothetical protein [Chroococcidiopsis sp.]|uniref:hypothetical protein n=1 Tax=Chroococcidiopsis sp. TaxID=3088168 RepID=UPI003F3E592D
MGVIGFGVLVGAIVRFLFGRDRTTSPNPVPAHLRLKDLYDLGRRIDQWKRWGNLSLYQDIVFVTPYGGELLIHGPLNLPILSQSKQIELHGTRIVYSRQATIRARKLKNVVDLDNYPIYEAANGVLFVFRYSELTANKLADSGVFSTPNLAISMPSTFEDGFKSFASNLLEQVNAVASTGQINDPLFTISLVNRIVEAQRLAFIQGTQARDDNPTATTLEEMQEVD